MIGPTPTEIDAVLAASAKARTANPGTEKARGVAALANGELLLRIGAELLSRGAIPAPAPAPAPGPTVLWSPLDRYKTMTNPFAVAVADGTGPWVMAHAPAADPLYVAGVPGAPTKPPVGGPAFALYAALAPGETSSAGPRSEVAGLVGPNWTPDASKWEFAPGSQHRVEWPMFLDRWAPHDGSKDQWGVVTQFRGLDNDGSGVGAVEDRGGRLVFVSNVFGFPDIVLASTTPTKKWVLVTVDARWSPGSDGWWKVMLDGVPKGEYHGPTMRTVSGQPDPVYLKQGYYGVPPGPVSVYHGPVVVSVLPT